MKTKLMDDNSLFGGCFPAGDFWKQIDLSPSRNDTQPLHDSRCESGSSSSQGDASLHQEGMGQTRGRSWGTGLSAQNSATAPLLRALSA